MLESMEIRNESLGAYTVLHLRGEFDGVDGQALLREIELLCAAGVDRVALNLSEIYFIDSSALGAILRAYKTLNASEGRLVVSRPSSFCREIMAKVGLERAVSIYASDEEAGRALVA